jgi:ubiquinone/menaquinone biosynthesis C-methylase UbiE
MTESLSFDRAADFYDRTRQLPEPVAMKGIQAILDAAGRDGLILDVGTGSGRISIPLLRQGADLIGVDLSMKMMAQLRGKLPTARLVQSDAALIPFPGRHFDAVLTCHVMHLIGPWREALGEFRRILKPGGVYVNARTDRATDSAREPLDDHWKNWIADHGGSWQRPGVRDDDEFVAQLRTMKAAVARVEVVHFTRSDTARDVIEGIEKRVHSTTWEIPDDMLAASIADLRAWARREYGPNYLAQAFVDESVFVLDVARFAP